MNYTQIDSSIFDIDYEILKLSTKKINGKTIYIMDNFYKYPQKIVDFANKQKFVKEYANYFPGDRFQLYLQEKHINELKNLINTKCQHYNFPNRKTFSTDIMCLSKFVPEYLKEKDKIRKRANPHLDDMKYFNTYPVVGLGYLCKVNHGGTGFYKHRELNSNLSIELNKCTDKEKIFPYNHFRLINKSCEKFELLELIEMKWNRFIVYEGDCLHSIYLEDYDIYRENDRLTTSYWFYAIRN